LDRPFDERAEPSYVFVGAVYVMSDETALADALEFVLSGRPERLVDMALGQMSAEQREGVATAANAMATLALALDPAAPSPGLRERVIASLRAKHASPPRAALVVCDMIVDHLTPGRVLEIPRAREIVPALACRIAAARTAGTPVVYVLDRHDADDPELEEWGTHAVAGSTGAEVWPDLAPAPGDTVVAKPSYSGFYETELEHVLDDLGVDTLVLTGCATEIQLMTTATDALQRGFSVEIPSDSQAGGSAIGEAVAMQIVGALLPYVPARRRRLRRIAERVAAHPR
jgi:nicotinamidase-related amidase